MNPEIERNLGEQPPRCVTGSAPSRCKPIASQLVAIVCVMRDQNLKPHDLVAASATLPIHKMVSRACKGRRLTLNTQSKVLAALNRAIGQNYALGDLFE